jgi:hypothetical protein
VCNYELGASTCDSSGYWGMVCMIVVFLKYTGRSILRRSFLMHTSMLN